MKSAIKELDDIAEDIIDLASGYILTDETFVNGVTFAYRKGELGAKHILLDIHVQDFTTGVPLKHVQEVITDGIVTYSGFTTRNGNLREKTMENGNYTITTSHPTYTTDVQTNIGIQTGKIVRLIIRLHKI